MRTGHAFLESLEPWEWEYWRASFKLDPFGQDWHVGSMIAAEIINAMQAIAAGMGGGSADDIKPFPRDAFTPFYDPDREAEQEFDDAVGGLESLVGLPDGSE